MSIPSPKPAAALVLAVVVAALTACSSQQATSPLVPPVATGGGAGARPMGCGDTTLSVTIVQPQYCQQATPSPDDPVTPVTPPNPCAPAFGCDPGGGICPTSLGCVGTIPGPFPGNTTCDGSPAQFATGTGNLPAGSTDPGSTIVQIFGFLDSQGGVYGWAYQTAHQDMFFQRNPAAAQSMIDALTGFLDKIPGLSGIASLLVGATTQPYQLTGTQWQNIQQGLSNGGIRLHKCYSKGYGSG